MAKWRLLLKTLPVALGVLAARHFLQDVERLQGAISFGDTATVLTAAALIMGLMLGGVIGDYREAEKLIPAVSGLFAAFESYATRGLQVAGKDDFGVRVRVSRFVHAVNEWLYGRIDTATMWASYAELNAVADDCARAGVSVPYMNQIHGANNNLGGAVDRIDNIRSTSYIKSGYALLEFLVGAVIVLMAVCTFENTAAGLLVPVTVSMTYTVMLLLIKDLDNPFAYGDNGGKGSAVDVDIMYWTKLYKSYQ